MAIGALERDKKNNACLEGLLYIEPGSACDYAIVKC